MAAAGSGLPAGPGRPGPKTQTDATDSRPCEIVSNEADSLASTPTGFLASTRLADMDSSDFGLACLAGAGPYVTDRTASRSTPLSILPPPAVNYLLPIHLS